jgi:8-oxo-dGTP pyrophosphatase MutT (NUDIX family)
MYKNFCTNCGHIGHNQKKCKEPITSIGIICLKINNLNIRNKMIMNLNLNNEDINISDIKYNTLNIIKNNYDKIKYLLIRRKHSLGYLEFIRGKYKVEKDDKIISLLKIMTPIEKEKILNKTFDELWTDIWKKTSYIQIYQNEYNRSKNKFTLLKSNNKLSKLVKATTLKFLTPEWGFPKGRRSNNENNLDTAIREFKEESSLTNEDFHIIKNIDPVQEIFFGSNGIKYKHIYYIALYIGEDKELIINNSDSEFQEIGDIGWFNYMETSNLIREYHLQRKTIITHIFLFLSEKYNIIYNYLIKHNMINNLSTDINDFER